MKQDGCQTGGSIEALAINEVNDKAQIVKVTSRLNILESAGLAIGSLCRGILAGLGADYAGNIIFNIFGFIIILLLTIFTVRESEHINTQKGHPSSLKEHLQKSFSFVRGLRTARIRFVLCSLTTFAMVTVETYWQPAVRPSRPPRQCSG